MNLDRGIRAITFRGKNIEHMVFVMLIPSRCYHFFVRTERVRTSTIIESNTINELFIFLPSNRIVTVRNQKRINPSGLRTS